MTQTAKTDDVWTGAMGRMRQVIGTSASHIEYLVIVGGGDPMKRRTPWGMWSPWEERASLTTSGPTPDMGGTLAVADPPDDFTGVEAEQSTVTRAELLHVLSVIRLPTGPERRAAFIAIADNLTAGLDARTTE